jgi:hypothetical protein
MRHLREHWWLEVEQCGVVFGARRSREGGDGLIAVVTFPFISHAARALTAAEPARTAASWRYLRAMHRSGAKSEYSAMSSL